MSKDAKSPTGSNLTMRSSRTGRMVTVKGFGALKGSGFAIRNGIDPTEPTAKEAQGEKADR